MRIFVDTSALFALLDRDDANHKKAKEVWNKVLNPRCFFSREHKSIYKIKRNELQ